jgi:hypothetical protein
MKRLVVALALAASFPAWAQSVTATLQVQGDVRISTGTDFVPAVDKQPVVVGQRIMVGENATAKIRYSAECSRTYSDPGVYTVAPAACRKDKDRKDQQDQEQAGNDTDVASAGGSSLTSTLVTVIGAVVAGQQVIQHQDDAAPNRPISH